MNNNIVNLQVNIAGNAIVALGILQKELDKCKSTAEIISEGVKNIVGGLEDISGAVNAITAPGIEFEQSMADMSAATGIVGGELEQLSDIARQTGRESGIGAKAAAEAFATLASQIDLDKVGMEGLVELQEKTITLSQASGMSMNSAATALTGAIDQFGLGAEQADRVINVLAAGSRYGSAEINDLSESFKVVGSQSAMAGVSIEETAGALEILSKNNVKGSEAGTQLRDIVSSLQAVFGADLQNMTLTEALDQLKPKLEDAAFMSQNFTDASMESARLLINNADAVGEMTTQLTDTNTAYEQAETRTDTVAQMMARCRANVDDLKIGFFEATGSVGGYVSVIADQLVNIAPLFTLVGGAAKLWTGFQLLLNASLWMCPITWIVLGIAALIGIIVACATYVDGWGKQWDSIVNFMTLVFQFFVESIKLRFNTVVDQIMTGLDNIKLGWYKFKEAMGWGDSSENQAMIAQIGAGIEQRKKDLAESEQKIEDLKKGMGTALTWELSWKKGEDKGGNEGKGNGNGNSKNNGNGKGKGDGKGNKGNETQKALSPIPDTNNELPNLKGTTLYSGIVTKLSSFKSTAITTAASLAMPVTMAATELPATNNPALDPQRTEYTASRGGGGGKQSITMSKFCDKIEIHIANADGKGYRQIEAEVTKVLKQVFDDYGA